MKDKKIVKKLTGSGFTSIILVLCLFITTFALILPILSINDNVFATGNIKINLNDGKPVISEKEFLFEPGMTIKKDFFLKNESDFDVYYKLYFNNIKGDLYDVLEITIKDDKEIIYSGNISNLNKKNVSATKGYLKINEKKDLSIYFHYPENSSNNTQNLLLTFDLCADAVQTKNNPNKSFD